MLILYKVCIMLIYSKLISLKVFNRITEKLLNDN